MNVNDVIKQYEKAIETDKVLEGQYQVLSNQLSKLLAELGMTYTEALQKEQKIREYLKDNIPKIQKYIEDVQDKKNIAEEYFV